MALVIFVMFVVLNILDNPVSLRNFQFLRRTFQTDFGRGKKHFQKLPHRTKLFLSL